MFKLNGKVAIVTGGNGVLGGAIAHGLSKNGAKVAVLGRTEETVNARVKEIKEAGGEALALVADVLDKESLIKAKDKILAEWGSIDILVNGAGGNKKGAVITPDQEFFDLSMEALDGVNQLNFNGTILPTLIFSEEMVKQKKGSIINISSMAAQKSITRVMGYSASKAAIDNFTKWLSVELNHKYGEGVRVNAIAPGFFVGEQNRDLLLNQDGSLTARGQKIVDNTPMARFGKPEELQGAAVWLASDASAFVTGIVVPVDGGFSAFGGV
ncbi:SDR family oxidoreductase [Zunongwangia atlantica]|uniref:D-mannonate oxidoreductase n=1 Tax=Zunongwangia atlantica 22II14-10F7 TaxID=1185767 RepID=A0A1Y1SZE6_9FLAO|nr:SDR family oxidoreductase [Zunongwangia atlantica]ORL44127.1 D-mannonate oxidoreductase [Zunongwangia atlantica 22II14-10F7]